MFGKTLCLVGVLCFGALFQHAEADCPGQNLLPRPADPAASGPWPVGVKTIFMTEKNITVDIWYPAIVGSDIGQPNHVYNIRDEHLPPNQAIKIPDEENPLQKCDCYYGLPLDVKHGPYPVHLHVHGTAGFRSTSMHQMTHYASRGFVVFAADHPGITLKDMVGLGGGPSDQRGDAERMIADIERMELPQLQFLKGHIDIKNLAVSGHSAGGGAIRTLGSKAKVVQPWASTSGVVPGEALVTSLTLAGEFDGYQNRYNSYVNSPSPKRFVGVASAGHVFCSDLCWIGEDDGGLVDIAVRNGIYIAALLAPLIGSSCEEGNIYNEEAWLVTNYATAAAQEEILMCDPSMADKLYDIQSHLGKYFVKDYFEDL